MANATKKEKDETNEDFEETKAPDLQAVLDRMDTLEAENALLKTQVGNVQSSIDSEDDVESPREHATDITLATINGEPITDMKLEKVVTQDNGGNYEMRGYKAICHVPSKDKAIEITYGNRDNPMDFINLPRLKFSLINQDPADLSGASRIERNVVVDNFGKVPQVDRSSGTPVPTGKMVNVVTKRDVRYYTIEVNGEAVELAEDKIYR